LIVVRLVHDRCTISMDTTGELLHRRGYRLETAKAPLRENLAAGLLLASGWQPSTPLIDPFCGSGTLPIEAALIARSIAPGKNRRFAFMNWPNFDSSVWEAVYKQAVAREHLSSAPILGSDRDEGAIRISSANAERAGVLDSIGFSCQAFSAVEPPEGKGWVVTNPPYGIRVSPGHDLRNLYTHLGDVLREKYSGWTVGILCSDPILLGHTKLKIREELSLINGGIPVKFRIFEI
jgi:putative N6-adenine-specific DNA methylase